MPENENKSASFFDEPGVENTTIPVGTGVPFGIKRVTNPQVGIGGAYGAWGQSYDNEAMPAFLEEQLGGPIPANQQLNLAELGFKSRHHIQRLSDEQNLEVEV